jgi:WD40 repeat protein
MACLLLSLGLVLGAICVAPSNAQNPKRQTDQPPKADLSKLDPKKAATFRGHKKDVWRVVFHPDGKSIASCGDDAQIIMWNLKTGLESGRDNIHDQVVHDLDFNGRGSVLAAVGQTPWGPGFCGILRVRDLLSGEVIDIESKSPRTFECVAFHPQRGLVAAGGADRALRVWDLGQARMVPKEDHKFAREFFEFTPRALPGEILAVAFHPQKPMIAVGCRGGFVRLFEIKQGQLVPARATIDGGGSDILCMQFRPATFTLLAGGEDGSIRYWNTNTGALIRKLDAEAGPVNDLAFDPAGALLSSAHANKVVKLWDAESAKKLDELSGHEASVLGVDISADGRQLASCGRDFAVIVWDLYPNDVPLSKKKAR